MLEDECPWVFVVLFVLKEAIRWVRASAPAGCSPRGLGGMSYPFKGFESSGPTWGRRDVAPVSSYCDASCSGMWEGGEVPRFSHTWGVGQQAPDQLPCTVL
jgi:hypothetical protein